MKIIVKKCPASNSSELRGFVRTKISSVLHRFSGLVSSISVFLADENGPKKGVDKSCKIVVNTVYGDRIVIRERKDRWEAAVSNAVKRARRNLLRANGLTRHVRNIDGVYAT